MTKREARTVGKIKVLFWFDVEDFINPESEEALLGLLDILDQRGIVGIFKFVGEKIRVLEQNGRHDILKKLKRHEIGYHTDWHSIQPVVTEYLEPLGFRVGAEEFTRREAGGLGDLARITGQPVRCYGQPGQAWAPQTFPALNRWGVAAYLDGHDQVTMDGRPFWYGGLLNLDSLTGLMGLPLKEGALPEAKREFDRLCELQKEEAVGFISIFYHPTEFVFTEFWDAVNFSEGRNPPREEWIKPPFRPEGHMRMFLDRVGEFIDYTLTKPDVSYASTDEVLRLERTDSRALSGEEVKSFARRTGDELIYLTEEPLCLSASELFWVFRQHVLGLAPVPELVYGPERGDGGDPVREVRVREVIESLRAPMPEVCGFKQMPDYFRVGDAKMNPVTMTCTLASIIREGLGEDALLKPVEGKLASVKHALNEGEWTEYWPIFSKGLKVPNIVEMSRVQTWTIKPALF
jgi:hypothetical protein